MPTEPQHGNFIQTAVKLTAQLWNRSALAWPTDVDCDLNSAAVQVPEHANKPNTKSIQKRPVQTTAYIKLTLEESQKWLDDLAEREKPPNKEQRAFLQTVVERCRTESKELGIGVVRKYNSEPCRICLMGMVGAGKVYV